MYERASKESFTSRFYKQHGDKNTHTNSGGHGYESHGHYESDDDGFDERFKQVEWFQHKNTQEAPIQSDVLDIDAPSSL